MRSGPGIEPGPLASDQTARSEPCDAQLLQAVIHLEVREKLFPAPLPEEACRGNRRYRQQTDTEDANRNLLWLRSTRNLTTRSSGKFRAKRRLSTV